jgi:hypothetical protein
VLDTVDGTASPTHTAEQLPLPAHRGGASRFACDDGLYHPETPPLDFTACPHWHVAAQWITNKIDDDLRQRCRNGVLPWERQVGIGEIDWWHVHSYALDRLDEILKTALPDGELIDGGTTWRGRHDQASAWFVVSLLSGSWSEPATGKRGDDIVGLLASIYGVSMGRAARKLARWLGIEAVRR